MRKILVIILTMSIVLEVVGCTTKFVSVEESEKNFSCYLNSMQKITEEYGLILEERQNLNVDSRARNGYKEMYIFINDYEYIEIYLINDFYESDEGTESFSIDYILEKNESSESIFV